MGTLDGVFVKITLQWFLQSIAVLLTDLKETVSVQICASLYQTMHDRLLNITALMQSSVPQRSRLHA